MGGDERLAKHRGAGQARRPRPGRPAARPGLVPRARHAWSATCPADGIVAGSGHDRRAAGHGRRRGLHDVAGTIAAGATPSVTGSPSSPLRDQVPLIMLLEGAGYRPTDGPRPVATDLLMQAQCSGHIPAGHRRARRLRRPRRADRTDVGLHGHDRAGRPSSPPGPPVVTESHRRGRHQGGPRRPRRRGGQRPDPQRRRRRRRRARPDPPVPVVFPSARGRTRPGARRRRRRRRACVDELLDIVPRDNRRVYDMRRVST